MTIPPASSEALARARAAAVEVRQRRSEIKDAIRARRMTVGEVLDLCRSDDVVAHIRVYELLKAVPRVGDKRAHDIMDRLGIAEGRRLRGLGKHQIAGLKAEFE
ncbi:integration host factor, actinobacterial type [Enemella sp. A6]|uniref:integration host factor, actinobacterial type n=1 Tax=Enemella sp. A6 TaxID=3440152 RepID=UPI003EBD8952